MIIPCFRSWSLDRYVSMRLKKQSLFSKVVSKLFFWDIKKRICHRKLRAGYSHSNWENYDYFVVLKHFIAKKYYFIFYLAFFEVLDIVELN